MAQTKKQGELVLRLLQEYPDAGSLTLARRLFREFPEHFNTIETARTLLRYYRGQTGDKMRKALAVIDHVKDIEKLSKAKYGLPQPVVTFRDPYILPKASKRILILSDLHIPYHNADAITDALDYGRHKEIDTIILNGDMIDMYQLSRYSKDGRKPNLEYELETAYEFLRVLRQAFPSALIIYKYGNHEERWDAYLKANGPAMYMIATESIEDYLALGELRIQAVKDKRIIKAGHLNIAHGHEIGVNSVNVNPARSAWLKAKCNILIGHLHKSSEHIEKTLNNDVMGAWSTGCLCAPQDYAPYASWNLGYAYIVMDGENFWVQNRKIL